MRTHALIALRFGDWLEVRGECPWCPCWEMHYHWIDSDTNDIDRSDFWVPEP